ncbi:MAG: 2-oxoglutarate dehydrogenase E1 component [bacterium]|nr:2-oxoglutarate dehydrogenase E1 component [bacterium]
MTFELEFHGPNAGYILELYERYRQSPDAVDASTRAFFSNWTPPNGRHEVEALQQIDMQKVVAVVNYAQAIRQFGHLEAQLDPLGSTSPGDPELAPEAHGLTEAELAQLPAFLVGGPIAEKASNALEATTMLKEVYSSTIGYDYDHIRNPEERYWLREAAESRRFRPVEDRQLLVALLERLTEVEVFELFLQKAFPTKYRFSIEGLDMMVPLIDEVIAGGAETGVHTIAIGMAHRGRLNVLAHIMNRPYEQILSEFKDPAQALELQDAIGWTTGDVKYHAGVRAKAGKSTRDDAPVLTMPPNPSHLEVINPVAVGMARAAGSSVDQRGEPTFNPALTMQILIHGDAAFPGQGIVAETFNLARLPGYWTGGTIHIISNNQIGFTTLPDESRSTLYSSDMAKGYKVPVVHVNADDPIACLEVARLAFAYQEKFEKDFLIDLIGYRRYGHNELDEPNFTQPLLYQKVRSHPTVRKLWADALTARGMIDAPEADALVTRCNERLQHILEALPSVDQLVEPLPAPPPPGAAKTVKTAVSEERLLTINEALAALPSDFNFYSKRLEGTIRTRREALNKPDEATIDWATAEELAFATILEEGISIRLTGQDSERGTFSHRHAVLHDANTGENYVPLQALPMAKAAFDIRNSPLSESAALGFEYGYNVQAPERLVLWEAQYGDFNNNAQVIIDEFIVSAREKWGQTPSLVLLLPHGHEGAGPDHTSARLERFLQMSAKKNLRVVYPTTAAQYFHLLRRQALLLNVDPLPLVVMTPKSLLRNPAVFSQVSHLTEGRWYPVIDDLDVEREAVRRLVMVSGKFYYDLISSDHRKANPQVAIVRLEQLYPFPADDVRSLLELYPNLEEIVWAQEEPKNMGAWDFVSRRIERIAGGRWPLNYVGRRRSSSPAEGSPTAHKINQSMIVEYAFTWAFQKQPVSE